MDTHEAVCAERYSRIDDGLARLESNLGRLWQLLLGASGTIMIALGSIAWAYITKGH